MKEEKYIDIWGDHHKVHEIFAFTRDDRATCGNHQCGYTTDGAVFIKTAMLPKTWKIREAPQQLIVENFTTLIGRLSDLTPLSSDPTSSAYGQEYLEWTEAGVMLDNKYVLLVKQLGCSLEYQDKKRTDNRNTWALAITKDGEVVGMLMPVKPRGKK